MKPQDVKHHHCPVCSRQATVLVDIKNYAHFARDNRGNIQYYCTNCGMTFSVNRNGIVVAIKLES